MPTNEDRIDAAIATIEAYRGIVGDFDYEAEPEAILIDLLTNLRHYAHKNKIKWTMVQKISTHHYINEISGLA